MGVETTLTHINSADPTANRHKGDFPIRYIQPAVIFASAAVGRNQSTLIPNKTIVCQTSQNRPLNPMYPYRRQRTTTSKIKNAKDQKTYDTISFLSAARKALKLV